MALARRLRQLRPIIVPSGTPKDCIIGMVAAWLARVPVWIYMKQGLPHVTTTGWRQRLLVTTERLSCRLAHRVLAVGPSLRQVAIDERLCPPTKMIVLAGGSTRSVDALVRRNPDGPAAAAGSALLDTLGIPADVPVVGFVGRLVRDKDIVDLADARCRLRNPYPELRLLLVGPFEERDPVPPDADATIQADPRVR